MDTPSKRARQPASRRNTARQELELAVRMKLRVLASSSRQHSQAIVNSTGVGLSQLAALAEIDRNPGIRITELAFLRNIRPATASNLVDKLAERGWVLRKRKDADQRNVRLFLTSRGKKTLDRHPSPSRDIITTALTMIPGDALATLDQQLDQVILSLERIVAGHPCAPTPDTNL